MKKILNQIKIGIALLALSALIYYAQLILFHSKRDTEFYLLQDLAFIPIQVLFITIILNRILNLRQKREMLKKMNMVIGAFFSSVGTELISRFSAFHTENDNLSSRLLINPKWQNTEFISTAKMISSYTFVMDHKKADIKELKNFILHKREFLLGLLENANLLEHDSFTDMLWAVFHVADELACREDLDGLPDNDYKHLEGDFIRAYSLLIYEWLYYLNHLKNDYPYLYSLAARKNPFDKEKKIIFD